MDDAQVQAHLAVIEGYMVTTIEEFFPLKVVKFLRYDSVNNDKELIGLFVANNMTYAFSIEQEDRIPTLKPVVSLH